MDNKFLRQIRKNKIVLVAMLSLLLSACGFITVDGSGNVISESREVHDFNRVVFGGTGELLLIQNGQESLTVTADDNLLDYVESEVRDGTLYIGLKDATLAEISPSQPIRFDLIVKDIAGLDVAGAARAETGDIVSDLLSVNVSGLSTLTIGGLQAQKLDLQLSGSNEVKVTGSSAADEQEIAISGSSNYSAPGMRSKEVDATIDGSGNATVWATDYLYVNASGTGSLEYYGSPLISQNVTGSVKISSLEVP